MPQRIQLNATVKAPVEHVFSCLNDHEQFGRIWPGETRRVKDSEVPGNLNDIGSEREISLGPIPGLIVFREAIVTCERPHVLEYMVVGKWPVKNHLGSIELNEADGVTSIDYTIELDSAIPCLTRVILKSIQKQWARGFPALKAEMENSH